MMSFTKQALSILVILSNCLFVFMPTLHANTLSQPVHELSPKQFNDLHQCDKTFEYDIHLLGNNVGKLHRTIKWHNKTTPAKATVTSFGEVSFLWLDSTYHQTSSMQYSPQYQHFLTPSFSQKVVGFRAREMTALMSDDGLSSTVTLDNKVYHYQHKKENKHQSKYQNQALYDLDALGSQIRINLLQGKKRFTLFRQASKKIEAYQFEVAGNEVIDHKKWGQLNTTKVVEVGKHKGTVLWFSSKHDHQLVKAQLDLIFSPTVWLSSFNIQCEQ